MVTGCSSSCMVCKATLVSFLVSELERNFPDVDCNPYRNAKESPLFRITIRNSGL